MMKKYNGFSKRIWNKTKTTLLMVTTVSMVLSPSGRMNQVYAADMDVQTLEEYLTERKASFPERHDLRDYGYVTPVKDQGAMGTCYAFGAIAAAETSILSELGMTYQEFEEVYGFPMDLSERGLAYFVKAPLTDATDTNSVFGSQTGEGVISKEDAKMNSFMEEGWEIDGCTAFSAGVGPALEIDIPYRGREGIIVYCYCDEEKNYLRDENSYKVVGYKNVPVVKLPDGNLAVYDESVHSDYTVYYPQPYSYDREIDDWSVDEELRFQVLAQLEKSRILPASIVWEDGDYVYDELGTLAIKNELLEGRAVCIGCCMKDRYLNPSTWAQYAGDDVGANHDVTVVGYDDTYPAENFLEGMQPPADGAWIVKNSWGSIDGEFPNDWGIDGSGYFYLSYYDKSLDTPESYDFDLTPLTEGSEYEGYIVQQYDYLSKMPYSAILDDGGEIFTANIFAAEENMILNEVAYTNVSYDSTIKADIYLLDEDYTNPTDGKLIETIVEFCQYAGYHKLKLKDMYFLKKGQLYSVVITETGEYEGQECYKYPIFVNNSEKYYIDNDLEYDSYANGVINPGESWYYIDGGWHDLATDELIWNILDEVFGEGFSSECAFDNYSIKAYGYLATEEDAPAQTEDEQETEGAEDSESDAEPENNGETDGNVNPKGDAESGSNAEQGINGELPLTGLTSYMPMIILAMIAEIAGAILLMPKKREGSLN